VAKAVKANAVVGQSGGPTAVINASLVGVVEQACKYAQIENLYGAIHAVEGIVKEDFIDLKKLSADTLEAIAASPSSALGSSRDKPDAEYCARIFEVFKKRNIRYFFYIGGNDSADTANIISKMATEIGYELHAFHIPKTIDNDLLVTDHCPGYGSAAKFVACALMGDDLDNRALPGIKINVIMGRHAGFLTAASVLGKQREDDGPHLVYLPEVPVSLEKILSDVEAVYRRLGRCVIAKSEGIVDTDGTLWAQKISGYNETDAHGNVQLSGRSTLADFLADKINELGAKRVRADTFGYLQRSFVGLQSSVDVEEARSCGRQAVRYSIESDKTTGSVAIRRLGNGADYKTETFCTTLCSVAKDTKSMPAEFIDAQGNGVTGAFVEYAMPLTGGLPKTEYLGSYPRI